MTSTAATPVFILDADLKASAGKGSGSIRAFTPVPAYALAALRTVVDLFHPERPGRRAFDASRVQGPPEAPWISMPRYVGNQVENRYRLLVETAALAFGEHCDRVPAQPAHGTPDTVYAVPEEDVYTVDRRPGHYYVSAREGGRTWPVAGPFSAHIDALLSVAPTRAHLFSHAGVPMAIQWAAFGTCRIDDTEPAPKALWTPCAVPGAVLDPATASAVRDLPRQPTRARGQPGPQP